MTQLMNAKTHNHLPNALKINRISAVTRNAQQDQAIVSPLACEPEAAEEFSRVRSQLIKDAMPQTPNYDPMVPAEFPMTIVI